ncbi:LOW QUALITY PROTEIN: atrial natriuretic peptide receptor 1-like [Haliotis rubra]|uniref:LOW QUALITY PROTEIN: atrial natriuretic peptide receptor 1-like n=1 Tax=Haliotis rubra TaxID=36100 RepID=UPI001EE4FD2A|nr:LOW QUALITY PROTEIN: atrial natriuretic peptide receptor 1-like [Haliotis rubra]
MAAPRIYTLLTYLILSSHVRCWHDLTNTDYHCWPIAANSDNPTPFASCPGVNIRWIIPPPANIKAQEPFNVTYELLIASAFYPWAVTNNIFDQANGTGFSNAGDAETWCRTAVCPDPSAANTENCCIHHVNVHSCPLDEKDIVNNGLCGPWIPSSGDIFTHSVVMVGPVDVGNWTSTIEGLYSQGDTSVIAHFKVAKMHVAVEKTLKVLPRTVCGDFRCEGLEGEDCSSCPKDCGVCPLEGWQIAIIGVFVVIIVAVILGIVGYFQYKQSKLLWDESWIIPYEQILEESGLRGAFGSMISVQTGSYTESLQGMSQSANRRQVFANTALYDGRTIAVRKIRKNTFAITKAIRVEVKTVRELDHPNLCKFVGGCVEVPDVCLLSEYCPKGSLNDVLENEDVPLNWAFRFSFATDIARGMCYLHSHRILHGRLKASNCVVDDRWTVKITDYGLATYRREDVAKEDQEEREYQEKRNAVYIAPEIKLRTAKPCYASDVYPFSIILLEIATRNDPYQDADPCNLPTNWRPLLPDLRGQKDPDNACPCPEDYTELIECCWHQKPDFRPSFESAKKTLHRINPNKLSAVDLMMNMMEKYSKHLEATVAERTQDLYAEKQKTDRLLYSMLPMAVADVLRQGKPISAESFDACTIFFSDIVGFTTLSGSSTPIQVVALLNKLYTTFDGIIDMHDVYKVETIGDAYMVVSGVPKKTDEHACEIANMALDLVEASRSFIIPHKPDELLRIRVGLHSGSVCTGVVGLKMPRYCLFGDTVNTASRMESNGEAYKIHISSFTHDELDRFGGYICTKRGTIPIKGKGEMTTYWLIGRDDSMMTNKDKIDNLSAKKHIHILTNGDAQIRNLEVTLQDVEAGTDAYTSLPDFSKDSIRTRKTSIHSSSNDSGYQDRHDDGIIDC